MSIENLNQLPAEKAKSELLRCCSSHRWVEMMLKCRPYKNEQTLFSEAKKIWKSLGKADFLEAFSHHPKIGVKPSVTPGNINWASQEQSRAQTSGVEILSELEKLNLEYDKKFGFVFLICATGKSGLEILEQLKLRLLNLPETELRNAANEQSLITELRLKKLLGELHD